MLRSAVVGAGVALLAAIVAASALWGGGAPDAAWRSLAGAAALLGLLAAARLAIRRERARLAAAPAALLAGLALLAALQSLPLPGAAVARLSPRRAALEREALDGLVLPDGGARALSVNPDRTADHAIRWAAAAMVFAAAALWSRRRRDARVVLGIVAATAAVEAAIGLANGTGTFVNRNHLGGLLAMGLLAAAGLAADRASHVAVPAYPTRTARISAAFNHPRFWQAAIAGGMVLISALGLVVSTSRGAALGAGAGAVAMILLSRRSKVVLAALVAAAAAVAWIEIDPLKRRMAEISFEDGSGVSYPTLFRIAWETFREFPALGAGIGTYLETSAARWPETAGANYALFAHNDYLDTLAGGGVVGGLLLIGAVASILAVGLKRARTSPLAAGALGGLVALALQANAGFNFQMPGNLIPFAALAGALAGTAFGRARPLPGLTALLPLAAIALGAAAGLRPPPGPDPRTDAELVARLAQRPCDARALAELGWNAFEAGDTERADRCFRLARRRDRAAPEIASHASRYWRERGNVGEYLSALSVVLWSGRRTSAEVFEEALTVTGSAESLSRLVPESGPARARWEEEVRRFLAQRVR